MRWFQSHTQATEEWPVSAPRGWATVHDRCFVPHQHTLLRWLLWSPWQLLFQSFPGRARSPLKDTPASAPQMKKENLADPFPFWSLSWNINKGSAWFLSATPWPHTNVAPPRETSPKVLRTEPPAPTVGVPHTPRSSIGQWTGCESEHIWSSLSTSFQLRTQRRGGMEVKWEGTCGIWKPGWSRREKVMKYSILQTLCQTVSFTLGNADVNLSGSCLT